MQLKSLNVKSCISNWGNFNKEDLLVGRIND